MEKLQTNNVTCRSYLNSHSLEKWFISDWIDSYWNNRALQNVVKVDNVHVSYCKDLETESRTTLTILFLVYEAAHLST